MIESPKKEFRLKAYRHCERPNAANAYMVGNDEGLVCGGNLRIYIPYTHMTELCYPTVFKSRGSAVRFAYTYPL